MSQKITKIHENLPYDSPQIAVSNIAGENHFLPLFQLRQDGTDVTDTSARKQHRQSV